MSVVAPEFRAMSGDLTQLLAAAVQELQQFHDQLAQLRGEVARLTSEQEQLRAELATLGRPVIAEAFPPPPMVAAPPPPPAIAVVAPPPPVMAAVIEPTEPLVVCEAPRRPYVKWLPTSNEELPTIVERCRIKADACRWAFERRRLLESGHDYRLDIEPRDRDLIAHAKQLPDCFLWMSHSTAPVPQDPSAWQGLAGCFDVLAQAVDLIRRLLSDGDDATEGFERALDLLAEAQSSLRIAVANIDGPQTDYDQARVFGWLKAVANDRQIFVRRYMRLDDPADPKRWPELAARLDELDQRCGETRRKNDLRRRLLHRLKYKTTHLDQLPETDRLYACQSIADDVQELVSNGLPPSSTDLRELLMPYVDDLPELAAMPRGFQLAVREIDRFLASATDTLADSESMDGQAPGLDEVARMLSGKSVVLIEGDRRPYAAEALERAFRLSELIWIDTRAHESTAGFEPYVARSEVAMVLLAIRWSSHSYGEVQDFCRRYGKPFVRLPGGYNPNQVAAQILDQCSHRLTAS